MANIFKGLKTISDYDLRLEIALLESVTMGNAVRETGTKVLGKLGSIIGSLGSRMGFSDVQEQTEEESENVYGRIDKRCTELSGLTRDELEQKLKLVLGDKLREFMTASELQEAISEDRLSVTLINEAAKVYGMGQTLQPAVKAEEIYKKYDEQLINCILREMKAENAEQAAARDAKLQQALNDAPIENKRQLQTRIIIDEFSGRGLGRAIRKSAGTKKLCAIIDCVGTAPFPMVKSYIDVSFELLRGINRLKRSTLVHLVWKLVGANGGKMAENIDVLPSFLQADVKDTVLEEEKEFMKKVAAERSLFDSMEKARIQMERCDNELAELMEKTTEEEDIRVAQIKNNLVFAQKQYEQAAKEYNALHKIMQQEILVKATRLKLVWQAFYPRFNFEYAVFEHAVTRYTKQELLYLERMLEEMHESIDIQAYSVGTVETDNGLCDRCVCKVSGGKDAVILYSGSHISDV